MGLTFWIVLLVVNGWSMGMTLGSTGGFNWMAFIGLLGSAVAVRRELVNNYARLEQDED